MKYYYIFLLKERSDGGGTISRLFERMYVCLSVTNDVDNITVTRSSLKKTKKNLESNCNF